MKQIFVRCLFMIALFVSTTPPAYAQPVKSNCVVTKVGDPKAEAVLPVGCADGGPIVDWAEKIAAKLEKGGNGNYSKLQADVCNGDKCAHKKRGTSGSCYNDINNCYWCTWIVIDAYTLAGEKVPQNLLANGLLTDMQKLDGFIAVKGSGTNELKKVKPGFVIGFDNHIGLVKSISIDDRGNGGIETYESNSGSTSHKWSIDGGVIKTGGKPVTGFAGRT